MAGDVRASLAGSARFGDGLGVVGMMWRFAVTDETGLTVVYDASDMRMALVLHEGLYGGVVVKVERGEAST